MQFVFVIKKKFKKKKKKMKKNNTKKRVFTTPQRTLAINSVLSSLTQQAAHFKSICM